MPVAFKPSTLFAFLAALQSNMTAAGISESSELSRFVGAVGKTVAEMGELFFEPSPLMTINEVAVLLSVYPDTISTMHTTGKMPKPVQIGHRTKRFRRADIDLWIELGMPSRRVFEAAKGARLERPNGIVAPMNKRRAGRIEKQRSDETLEALRREFGMKV